MKRLISLTLAISLLLAGVAWTDDDQHRRRKSGLGLGIDSGVGGGGIACLLSDTFTTNRAAGAVHGTAAEAGPGTRYVTDTDSKLSLSNGKLVFAGASDPVTNGDPGYWLDAVIHVSGRLLVAEYTPAAGTTAIGWSILQENLPTKAALSFQSAALYYYHPGINVGTYANGTSYKSVLIKRGIGGFGLIKGGSYTNYTLVGVEASATGTTYPSISNRSQAGSSQFLIVPNNLWLPSPVISDGFSAWGTTDGRGHPESYIANVVYDGDSLTYGVGTPPGTSYPVQTAVSGATLVKTNSGAGGDTIANMVVTALTTVDPLYSSIAYSGNNICVIWGGSNDILNQSPTTVYNNIVAYCNNRRSKGWKVVVLTITPRNNAIEFPDYEADRQELNTLITTNYASFADGLADVGSDADLSDPTDLTYYDADGTHLNSTGYGIVAGYVNTNLSNLTTPNDPLVLGYGGLGAAWTTQQGTIAISSGSAIATALDGDRAIATVPIATAYAIIMANLTKGTTGCGLVTHYTDADNYEYAWHDGTNFKVIQRLGGVETTKITAVVAYSAGASAEMRTETTTLIRALYDGLFVNSNNTFNAGLVAQNAGIIFFDTDSTIDNFVVYARGNEGQYSTLDKYSR